VPSVDYERLSGNRISETSQSIHARVQAARGIQYKRFANGASSDIVSNADMRIGEIRQFCRLQDKGQSLMRSAMSQLQLSARLCSAQCHRILKLSCTIADLAGSEKILSVHLAEALLYSPKMMM
jgi:magnesium chelatase family protein